MLSPVTSTEELDRRSVRVFGIENTATIRRAYKSLKNTMAIGLHGLDPALERFRNGEVNALALGTESLQSLLPQFPGARTLNGHFHAAETAVAVPKGRTEELHALTV